MTDFEGICHFNEQLNFAAAAADFVVIDAQEVLGIYFLDFEATLEYKKTCPQVCILPKLGTIGFVSLNSTQKTVAGKSSQFWTPWFKTRAKIFQGYRPESAFHSD